MKSGSGGPGTVLHRGLTRACLLVAVVLCSSCGELTQSEDGWLNAEIREAVVAGENEAVYEGTGDFQVGRDPGAGVSVRFGLSSFGAGASAGQLFQLY